MNQTILIVDDFASVRLYHMSFLTRKGYRCLGACNGADALVQLKENRVDLVLLDMVMPEMDGNTFVARLAADRSLANMPVLVITSEEPLARAAFHGSSRLVSILVKPVMPASLLQRVRQLLPAPAPGSFAAAST